MLPEIKISSEAPPKKSNHKINAEVLIEVLKE